MNMKNDNRKVQYRKVEPIGQKRFEFNTGYVPVPLVDLGVSVRRALDHRNKTSDNVLKDIRDVLY